MTAARPAAAAAASVADDHADDVYSCKVVGYVCHCCQLQICSEFSAALFVTDIKRNNYDQGRDGHFGLWKITAAICLKITMPTFLLFP